MNFRPYRDYMVYIKRVNRPSAVLIAIDDKAFLRINCKAVCNLQANTGRPACCPASALFH